MLRVLDTGLLSGRRNIAFDQMLIEQHRKGATPDTLRFLRFTPTALIGRHQDLRHELDESYCAANGIELGRRVTGGGAIFLDEGQLGWELVCSRERLGRGQLAEIAARICRAAAAGLSRLGIDVRYRPRNDLEVDGRKIGGTGGFFDGNTLFYQGTVLGTIDPETMFSALRVPHAKRARGRLARPAERVTSLAELFPADSPSWDRVKACLLQGFESELAFSFEPGPLLAREASALDDAFDEIGSDEFVYEVSGLREDSGQLHAVRDTPGGIIEVHAKVSSGRYPLIESLVVSGDFFVTPPRVMLDLESALRHTPVAEVGHNAARFFSNSRTDLLSVALEDLLQTIIEAVDQRTDGN